MLLAINKEQKENIFNVLLAGRFDMATGRDLEDYLTQQNLNGISTLVFSLSQLEFIDSTGMGILIKLYRQYAKQGIKVEIENTNPDIEEVLEIIGVREIINETEDEELLI